MSCGDGLFCSLKVHHSIYGETDLTAAGKRGTFVEERRDMNEEIITPYIYLGLLSVMWQENKRFHWTVLTVINTHFNRLQIYGWTSLAAHFQKKLILSVWFVSGYFNGCWNVSLYFTSHTPNSRRKDCNFPPLWVVSSPWTCFCFF